MLNLSIDEMEEFGIADYYLDLEKYIKYFINKNYPLTEEDIRAMANDETTANIEYRKNLREVLLNELEQILIKKKEENIQFLAELEKGNYVKPITTADYKREILNYINDLLEVHYNYNKSLSNHR